MAVHDDRSRLAWVVESFSVIAAGAFVVSAIGSAAVFWLAWGINYFYVASPQDVIMGGFVVFLFILTLAMFFILLVALFYTVGKVFRVQKYLPKIRLNWIVYGAISASFAVTVMLTTVWIVLRTSVPSRVVEQGRTWELVTPAFPPMFGFPTGLQVANESKLPENCRGSDVLWLGEKSAVIRCKSMFPRVFHNIEDLVSHRDVPNNDFQLSIVVGNEYE